MYWKMNEAGEIGRKKEEMWQSKTKTGLVTLVLVSLAGLENGFEKSIGF